jgi:hypothetical protein
VIEFKYINRKLRLTTWVIEFVILTPLGLFFLLCFWTKGSEVSHSTLLESFFGFSEQWRTVGYIGFPITFATWVVLPFYLLRKNGTLRLSTEKIQLTTKGRTTDFDTSLITKLAITKDIPFAGDERSPSQQAGRLQFSYGSQDYDLEFTPTTVNDYKNMIPITQSWKEKISGYKEEYR